MEIAQNEKKRKPLVLITRPVGQHAAFAQKSHALGFRTTHLPCIEIQHNPYAAQTLEQQVTRFEAALFISANAVHHTHRILPLPWSGIDIHAIGSATSKALAEFAQIVTIAPAPPYNSEAYLAQVQNHLPESLLILKGTDGRDLIKTHLSRQGVVVKNVDVYERCKPCPDPVIIRNMFIDPPDIVCVTSDEILNNLWELCSGYTCVLANLPLVVNSQRCANKAVDLGFDSSRVLIANPAGDDGQLDCLREWLHTGL